MRRRLRRQDDKKEKLSDTFAARYERRKIHKTEWKDHDMDTNKKNNAQEVRDMYGVFCRATIKELENALLTTKNPEERAFYRKMLNLKLQTEQEKVVGERLI